MSKKLLFVGLYINILFFLFLPCSFAQTLQCRHVMGFYINKVWYIRDIAVDPTNPCVVYVALDSLRSGRGGVSKTTDCGKTWRDVTNELTFRDWYPISLAIDPKSPNTVYLSRDSVLIPRDGLWRSTDGGEHWKCLYDSSDGLPFVGYFEKLPKITFHPDSTNIIYGGVDYVGDGGRQLYRSTDRGEHWKRVSDPIRNGYLTRITIHPDSLNIFYAASDGIGKSTNYGKTWKTLHDNAPVSPGSPFLINPDSTHILLASVQDYGFYRSTNAGTSWYRSNEGIPTMGCSCSHDIAMHPKFPNIVYSAINVCNPNCSGDEEKGVYKSTDFGKTWVSMSFPYNADNIGFADDSTGGTLYVGVQGGDSLGLWVCREATVGVDNENLIHQSLIYSLSQNYPNPFNKSTEISFSISESTQATLKIYNVKGELIKVLLDNQKVFGSQIITWYGLDNENKPVPSGIYFYVLETNNYENLVRKMLLLK